MTDVLSKVAEMVSKLPVPDGIQLEHIQPTIGTVVHGIDLREELSAATVRYLRELWLERKVIFFRDQPLTPEQHIRFGEYFGPLDRFLGTKQGPGPHYPEILVMSRGADANQREAFFHQDIPYSNPPIDASISLLRACPEVGGDTLFVDMGAAYENMSEWLKRAVVGLRAEHRFDEGIRQYNSVVSEEHIERIMREFPPTIHPVVQTHPETGKKILYVSLAYTSRILGIPRNESYALIKLLAEQAQIPEYQCRFRWQKHSMAMWDNRAVQHYACFDYLGKHRELHRVTVRGQQRWPDA